MRPSCSWAASAALLLAGCDVGPRPYFPPEPDPAPVVLAGVVRRLTPAGFVPAAGAWLHHGERRAMADAQGAWRLEVPRGPGLLTVWLDGHETLYLAPRAPLTRFNIPLAPQGAAVAGVLLDPRGAAVPGGTVVATAAALPTGRAEFTADADGFWTSGLAAGGDLRLTAHGRTPGGVPVETTTFATAGGLLTLDRARPLGTPRLVAQDGRLATIAADGMTTAPDELEVLVDDTPLPFAAFGDGQVTVPAGPPSEVRLVQLGGPPVALALR